MTNEHDQTDAKQRILDVALLRFSQQGYKGATVASICSQAHVNVAAINYYFHTKLELYTRVWEIALANELETNPFDGGIPESAPPEQRLQGRIRALIHRFIRPGAASQLAMLIIHELAEPSDPAIDQIRINAMKPPYTAMRELIKELLGQHATEQDIRFTTMSIFTPIFGLGLQQQSLYRRDQLTAEDQTPIHEQLPGAIMRRMIEAQGGIDSLIEHTTRFALGGIEAVRAKIESQHAAQTAQGQA